MEKEVCQECGGTGKVEVLLSRANNDDGNSNDEEMGIVDCQCQNND